MDSSTKTSRRIKQYVKAMKINPFFLLIILLHTINNYGQTLTQTVKGTVVDISTGAPINGATISLINAKEPHGTTTDIKGYFRLEKVPIGRQSFLCSFLGYEEYFISEVLVGSAKEINLTIRLTESLEQLNEVVLTASKNRSKPNNEMAAVSARSFSVEETKRFPASISDPGRMALSFAGVSNSDDTTNEIIIRGNAPNQLLWKIEGVEIPEPNHFSEEGYSPGAVSLISTNMLGKSDFFTGAFPAEYGNALSGVFDINLRNGNSEKREYAFQFGFLGTDLALEGPFSKNYKGSYLVNYRYSTLTVLNKIIEISDGSVPTFQDLSFKLNFPLSDKTTISLWGIGGTSEDNQENAEQTNTTLFENELFDSKTYMTGINFKHFFTNKTILDAKLSYSGNESNYTFSLTNPNTNDSFTERDILSNSAIRGTLNLTKKMSKKLTLKSGLIYTKLNYNVLTDEVFNTNANILVDENGNGNMFQFYVQSKYRINKKLTTSFGIHGTSFSVNKDFVLEPRAGIEYKIASKHTLSAGFGIHSRRLPLNQYFVKTENTNGIITTPNTKLDLTQATHYVIGYDWRIIKNGHLKIEAYYQDINKVGITANSLNTSSTMNGFFIDEELVDTGKAKNYGLEFTFEKFFSNQYYFLSTYSAYDSKYKAADNNWYDSRYNFNYTFNLVGGKEFTVGKTDNNIIGVNTKVLMNGGKRGTPYDIDNFNATGDVLLIQNKRNTLQFKDYLRFDASFYYRLNKPKASHIISLDIQNITNRDNVDSQFFNENTLSLENNFQLSLIPFLNYRIEF